MWLGKPLSEAEVARDASAARKRVGLWVSGARSLVVDALLAMIERA